MRRRVRARRNVVTCDYVEKDSTDRHAQVRCAHFGRRRSQREIRRGQRRGLLRGRRHASAVGARVRRRPHVSGQGRSVNGCPADPIKNGEGKRTAPASSHTFDPAAVERKLPGDEMEAARIPAGPGSSLNLVDQTSGGAPLAQRDALKLLAVVDPAHRQQTAAAAAGVPRPGARPAGAAGRKLQASVHDDQRPRQDVRQGDTCSTRTRRAP